MRDPVTVRPAQLLVAHSRRRIRWQVHGWLFLLPTLIVLAAVGLFPLGYLVDVSLRTYNLAVPGLGFGYVGLQNFIDDFHNPVFLSSLGTTLKFGLLSLPTEVVLGVWLAFLTHRASRFKAVQAVAKVALVVPMMITPVVSGLLWNLMLNSEFGIVDWIIRAFHGQALPWLGNGWLSLLSISGVDVWMWTPFVALIVSAALNAVPAEQYEAASLDGSGGWRSFWTITFPYLRPALTAALIIRTADIIRNFSVIYTLTDGGPGISTMTFSVYLRREAFKLFDLGHSASMSLLMLIVTIILSQLYVRFVYRDIEAV